MNTVVCSKTQPKTIYTYILYTKFANFVSALHSYTAISQNNEAQLRSERIHTSKINCIKFPSHDDTKLSLSSS